MPETDTQSAPPTVPPLGLRVAATLCWAYGILGVLAAFIGLTFVLNVNRPNQPLLLFGWIYVATGGVYCVAGYLLKRQHVMGGLLAAALATPFSIFQVLTHTVPALIGLVGNVAILSFLVPNWRHLKPSLFGKVGA